MLVFWIGFIAFVLVMLALDLGVFNRKAHVVSAKEAMRWVAVFVSMALLFNVFIYFAYSHNWLGIADRYLETEQAAGTEPLRPTGGTGAESLVERTAAAIRPEDVPLAGHKLGLKAAGEYFAGWLTEYSLSVDNIFVISLVFSFFAVPAKYQHRVLFWGILGALVMRGVMIGIGAEVVRRYEWVLLFFGLFLFVQGLKLLRPQDDEFDPDKSRIVRWTRRVVPVSSKYEGQKFFTLIDGKRFATPLFLVLVIVEFTDLIFAVDSIPAIFGITRDPFIVFTSNVFAILGLRSLYFALASLLDKFHYLHYSLAVILMGVGVKMLVESAHHLRWFANFTPDAIDTALNRLPDPAHPVHVPVWLSLGVIVGSLLLGMTASLVYARKHPGEPPPAV